MYEERNRAKTLDDLVAAQEVGGFTLPAPILQAHTTYTAAKAVIPPTAERLHEGTAAEQLANAYTAGGGGLDALEAARRVTQATADVESADLAYRIHSAAVAQVGARAVHVACEHADQIITDHLRPSYLDVLDQAKAATTTLTGHLLNARSLMTAPAKVRAAFLSLHGIAERHNVLWHARAWVVRMAGQQPKYDTQGLFVEFEQPLALRPTWRPPAPIWPLEPPSDPSERLMWLVTEGANGRPWMPTVTEQDAAFEKQFGESMRSRAQARRNAEAYGALLGG